MEGVDAEFAQSYTALAVTHGFTGSPHIDNQNVGPFYGLSLGDFAEGEGGVRVECSARVVAEANTGRYSLIYYRTEGAPTELGAAVFSVPSTNNA